MGKHQSRSIIYIFDPKHKQYFQKTTITDANGDKKVSYVHIWDKDLLPGKSIEIAKVPGYVVNSEAESSIVDSVFVIGEAE